MPDLTSTLPPLHVTLIAVSLQVALLSAVVAAGAEIARKAHRIFPDAPAAAQVYMNAATVSLVGSLLTAGLTALPSEHAPTALAVLKWTYVICGSGLQVLGLKLLADALTGRPALTHHEPGEA